MTPAAISKPELFERLAAGHAAGVTVVTPNNRLAQVLKSEFDDVQTAKGLTVWEDADILPFGAFIERCYEDALYAEGGGALPMLLSEPQSLALWEDSIARSSWAGALLDEPRTAKRASDAWQLAHDWGISSALDRFAASEDARAFADWARRYERRLKKEKLVDKAMLPSLELPSPKTKLLVAYAFDVVPRRTQELLSRREALACSPGRSTLIPAKVSFASQKAELESAARWARARLEEGKKRIGVVVPELKLRRREVARVFARTMGSDAPFNLSAGAPLADYPLVSFALSLLEFTAEEIEFERVSRLVRSPFLGGGEKEMAARAAIDAQLRARAPASLSLRRLIGLLKAGPLRERMEKILAVESPGKSPHAWAQHFTAVLEAAGFPGERAQDSGEFQSQGKFNEILADFARLSLVRAKMGATQALGVLRRMCEETRFQPESGAAPVQVLEILESVDLEFDALWVTGLTDEQWPLGVRAEPFLPLALQRQAGIPEALPDSALALDRRRTVGWLRSADEVVVSWARREEDRDLLPSPLIADIPERAIEIPSRVSWTEKIFKSGRTETFSDEQAPPLAGGRVRGGTRVLANQAACPFRAYARHRLRAEALEEPAPGPDAMERGQLLHALMAGLWRELKSSEALARDVSGAIERAAGAAVEGMGLGGRLADLEVARLKKLAAEWLALERTRPPFAAVAIEKKVDLTVAGLEMQARIDRMDRLADGSHAVIDYKTGARVTPKDWEGERPDDPQLPLYAIALPLPVGAAAFAKLRAGDMKFSGFSQARDAIPGVKEALDWEAMAAGWKSALEGLAREFTSGRAAVEPKRGLATCRRCDLHTLCRVHEKLSALGSDEEEGE